MRHLIRRVAVDGLVTPALSMVTLARIHGCQLCVLTQ
jgi:hypothetical protein